MKNKIGFIKNSGIYFVGDFLSKMITFFLLPIYSKYILPEDFGYYDISMSYIMLFIPLFTVEIWVGMMRFIKEEKNQKNIDKIISSGFTMIIIPLILIVVGIVVNYKYLNIAYFNFIIVLGFLFLLQKYYIFLCRSISTNKVFIISGIINTVVLGVSNYYMIVKMGIGLNSLFIAASLGLLFQIIFIEFMVKIINRLSFNYIDLDLLKKLFKFSFPLSLGSMLYFFLIYYNKFSIEQIIGLSGNGIYAIASKFTIAIVFLTSAFTMAWQDISFTMGASKANYNKFSDATNLYIKFVLSGSAIIIMLIHFVFPIMIDDNYSDSYDIIPLSIVATSLAAIGNFISQTLGAIKKTKIILYAVVISTLLNVLYVKYFISVFGVNGVNVALIITFLVNIIIRFVFLRVNLNMKINLFSIPFFLIYLFAITQIYYTKIHYYNYIGLFVSIVVFLFLFRHEMIEIFMNFINYLKQNKSVNS